jgi:hypothetical protein
MMRCQGATVLAVIGFFVYGCSTLTVDRRPSSATKSEVPSCIGEPFVYPKENPEAIFATMVARLPDDEVVARLVYAEALASRCLELHRGIDGIAEGLTESLAAVVWNRVRAGTPEFGEGARGVVLKEAQFRSTFGACDVAKRREFLCPSGDPLWDASVRAVEKAKKGDENPLPGVQHYFFPRHFDESQTCANWKGKNPKWAKPVRRIVPNLVPSERGKALSDCVSFYR